MGEKSDKVSKGGKPEERQTPVSAAQARNGGDSNLEQPAPSIPSDNNSSENEVTERAPPSHGSGGVPAQPTDNENDTRDPTSTQENVQQPCGRPQQESVILPQENEHEIQQNSAISVSDAQKCNPESSCTGCRGSGGHGKPNSSSTHNASSPRSREQNQPFAVRISPLKIRIGGVQEIPSLPSSTATPSTTAPPATIPTTPPLRTALPTTPTPPNVPPITVPPTTVPPTTTPPITTPAKSADTNNRPTTAVQQVTSGGAGPRNELRSPRSSDLTTSGLRSWVNAGIFLQRAMRSLHSPHTPRVVRRLESAVSPSMITERIPEARSLDHVGEARLDEQRHNTGEQLQQIIGGETQQRSVNEYDRIFPDWMNNNGSQMQSDLIDDMNPQALHLDTEHNNSDRTPQPPRTPRFSHTHRFSHTTGPLAPLPRTTTLHTPRRYMVPPPTPQLQTPRLLQLPQTPVTPGPLPLLPPPQMRSCFTHPSKDDVTTRHTGEDVYRYGTGVENSTQTPQHHITAAGVPSVHSDGRGRLPRMPPTPDTPVATRTSGRIVSRFPQAEILPWASLPREANAHRVLAPPVTTGDRQYPMDTQAPSPTGVRDYQVHQHVANQRVQGQEANRTPRAERGHDKLPPTDAGEESNANDMLGKHVVSEEDEREQLWIPTPSCKPPQDSRKEDDDPPEGTGGYQSTGKVLLKTSRTSLKRSQITDNQQRKRQSRGRDTTQNSERDTVVEKSMNPESDGPNRKTKNNITPAPSTSTDKSRTYNARPGIKPVSRVEPLHKNCEQLTTRQGQRMKKTITHLASSGNRSYESVDTGRSSEAPAKGSQDGGKHGGGERYQDKRNTVKVQAATDSPRALNGDRSEHLTNESGSNSVDPLRSDGNRQVLNGTSAQSRLPPSNEKQHVRQVPKQLHTMKRTTTQGGRDPPEIEAWLEEPWIPRQKRYSSEHIIRSKDVRIYKTSPKPERSRSSDIPTPQRDEPSAEERQERLRLHQARMRREMESSDKKPASG